MRSLATALLALALAMGGCATLAPPAGPGPSAFPAGWTLQGRIGVKNAEQSLSGQIRWQHHGDRDELLLTSPLGQGLARIVRDADGVTLELPGQAPRRAPDADALTREALGYVLPVVGLTWWVQARPDPSRSFEASHDAAGRLTRLSQDGWTIDYLQYAADARPRKLTVSREALEIRLVADSWGSE